VAWQSGEVDQTPQGASADGAVADTPTVVGVAPVGAETEQGARADAADPAASVVGCADDAPADVIEAAAMRRAMAKLVPGASGEFAALEPLRVGRFVLLERLAQGGMGVVHAGYDDTLDRRVAIKLIRGDRARSDGARQRLLREAQAMAKLSHPNVVQVFEAGEHQGQVFLAMELIEGLTLRGWLRERARGWREIVAAFLEVGRGLAAAHDAGVLHRDFKPDNVLVSAQGSIKVADFGLAALAHPLGDSGADSGAFAVASASGSARAQVSLTETGEIMGSDSLPVEMKRHPGQPTEWSAKVGQGLGLVELRSMSGDIVLEQH
jgi:tRNA A-37 threonylcarbamoyl transferase component Bud32